MCAQSVLGVNAFKDIAAGVRNVFGGRLNRCFASSAGDAIKQERHGRSPTG